VLDASDRVLYELPFGADRAAGASADMPFAFALPFAPGAETVELTMDGVVRGAFAVAPRLLRDAVSAVPAHGFKWPGSLLRRELLREVHDFEEQLARGARSLALLTLHREIRRHVAEWLVAGYATRSPLEYTKAQVLELIDELIIRIRQIDRSGACYHRC
jgi:hypothetical protein